MSVDLSKPEFSVLNILWQQHPLSVREVHDRLTGGWAYTTTKTVMDRMVTKRLLERDTENGTIVYRPHVGRAEGVAPWVSFIAEKILQVEPDEVIALIEKNKIYTAKEIVTIRKLIGDIGADKPTE